MPIKQNNLVYADFKPDENQNTPPFQLPTAHFGTLEAISENQELQVKYADKMLSAQSLIAVAPKDIGRRCALMFENGDVSKPLIIGFLWQPQSTQAETDKYIEAHESLTLKCGYSSLKMEADGTVRIKGLTITTQAYGANRIKGGSIKIN